MRSTIRVYFGTACVHCLHCTGELGSGAISHLLPRLLRRYPRVPVPSSFCKYDVHDSFSVHVYYHYVIMFILQTLILVQMTRTVMYVSETQRLGSRERWTLSGRNHISDGRMNERIK